MEIEVPAPNIWPPCGEGDSPQETRGQNEAMRGLRSTHWWIYSAGLPEPEGNIKSSRPGPCRGKVGV